MACLMGAMIMVALEATIVAAALPQIVGRLGGLTLASGVFSGFLLGQTVTTPIWGRLADAWGRRRVLLTGLGLFALGSLLCGAAPSLPWLIGARVLQGLGAGSVQPLCVTLVGDLYAGQDRARAQGWLSSVWGPSAIAAPLVGAVLLRALGWRWIFWVNVPAALAVMAGVVLLLQDPEPSGRAQRIHIGAAAAFTLAGAAVLGALMAAAQPGTRAHQAAAALAVVAGLAGAGWIATERRAANPTFPPSLWTSRAIVVANAATLLGCMTLMGVTSLLPLYVEGVLKAPPLVGGFVVTVMAVGWPLGALAARRLHQIIGLWGSLMLGSVIVTAGSGLFLMLTPSAPVLLAAAGSAISGAGMGVLTLTAVVIVQDRARAEERGAASASNIFARAFGGALGAAVLGAVFAAGAHGTALAGTALDAAMRPAFWAVFGLSALTVAVIFTAPRAAFDAESSGDRRRKAEQNA